MRELANCSQWNGRTDYRDSLKKKKNPNTSISNITPDTNGCYRQIHQERQERLQALPFSLCGGGKIHCLTGDYASVHIEPDSVIYCDIPYLGTNIYQKDGFDYERFYEWCFMQSEPVFISSYAMPDNFECVAVFKHTQSLCATKTSTVYEKLFIPKGQTEKCYQAQLSLF